MKRNSTPKKRKNILYKIFYRHEETNEDVLIYLGRTHQPLNNRLRGHFLKSPMMRSLDPRLVSRIEYADFKTEADMFLYEIYFINKWKPPLNVDDKSKEELTVDLPPVSFQIFDCTLLDKWRQIVQEEDLNYQRQQKEKRDLMEEYQTMRKKIFRDENLTPEEKSERWYKWLETEFEPRKQNLNVF